MSAPTSTPPPPFGAPTTGAVATERKRRRRPGWLVPLVAALLALLVVGVILFFLLHRSDNRSVSATPVATTAPGGLPASPSGAAALPPSPAPGGSSGAGTAGGTDATSGAAGSADASDTAGAGSATADTSNGPVALVGGGGFAAQPLSAASVESTGSTGSTGSGSTGSGSTGSGSSGAAASEGTVLFASGSAKLDAEARRVIAAAADRIKAQHPSSVSVTGFTDNVGWQETNGPLSRQRAAAVAAALRSQLAATDTKVTATGKGWSAFVASNDTDEGRQQNRRATVTVG